jgi:hypothetical protein
MKTRKEQLEIELAFENGAKIENRSANFHGEEWAYTNSPSFSWENTDYRIKEEQQRVPFDWTDAFNLLGRKFMLINSQLFYSLCTDVDEWGVYFGEHYFKYGQLLEEYEIWNDLLKVWEECSKVK